MLKVMITMAMRFYTSLLPEGLCATGYTVNSAILAIDAEVMDAEVICPGCGQRSSRRHGRYVRHLIDFPAHGRTVQVRLPVRIFRCVAPHCSLTTFSEKMLDRLARRDGRRTGRFRDLVAHLGRAMGGGPAQALGGRLRFCVSKDTFLRGAASAVRTMGHEPRVIGTDEWAWCKGQRYGTLICEALPDATQVADRWPLLQNASDAFLASVRRAMSAIRRTVCRAELDPGILTAAEPMHFEGFQRRQRTNVLIRRVGAEGVPIKRIVRITGLSRDLVRRVLLVERDDVFGLRQSSLTPWFPQLEQYWHDGCRNGAELWRRLRADGFQGSLRVVGVWARRQRRAEAAIPQRSGKYPPSRKIAA